MCGAGGGEAALCLSTEANDSSSMNIYILLAWCSRGQHLHSSDDFFLKRAAFIVFLLYCLSVLWNTYTRSGRSSLSVLALWLCL